MFVVLEGIDACGKGTQARKLANDGVFNRVRSYKFPDYGTPIGALIARHLEGKWSAIEANSLIMRPTDAAYVSPLNALVFQALQVANRMEVAPEMVKHQMQGYSLIVDRYWQSGWVYGQLDGLDPIYLEKLHEALPQPELNILIDVDIEHSMKRRPDRLDRYEEDSDGLSRAAQLYRHLWDGMAQKHGKDYWVVIDGRQPENAVFNDIRMAISKC